MIDRVSLLIFIMENGETTAWDVADHYGVDYDRAQRALQRQRERDLVRSHIETDEERQGARRRPRRIYTISLMGIKFLEYVADGGKISWNPYGRLYEGEE